MDHDFAVVDAVRESDPGHGGIAVFYRRRIRCVPISLPRLASFEGLCLRLSIGGDSLILLSIYRPGSSRPPGTFYDELTAVLETLVIQACPVVIGGDFNVHVEDPSDPDAIRLSDLLASFDMIQHVTGPTHRLGGTLDLVVTSSDYRVDAICVDPSDVISDHGLVACRLPSRRGAEPPSTRVVRSWRIVDRQAFQQAVRDSVLGCPSSWSSRSADELFALYDSELRRLADQFAPARTVRDRVRLMSPWFDAECRATRRNCRRLERRYRRTKSDEDRSTWVAALRQKHTDFAAKKDRYWTVHIARENHNPSKLWRSMAKILRCDKNTGASSAPDVHSAVAFQSFFD